jgi:hypothetical protein
MYPKNAASPPRLSIGAVVQISDGAVQTSGCTVRVLPEGGAEADGGGTTAYSTDGVVLYTPTQAETNYASFLLVAKKTGCIPANVSVVTTDSATAGRVNVASVAGTAQTAGDIIGDTNDIQTRLPASLVGGRMDSSIGAVAAGVIAAASFAANALDAVWSTAVRVLTAATNITSTGGTTVPQTGDSYARLGAPAGASVSADIAAIEAQTDDIGVAGAGLTALATAAALTAVAAQATAIEADTQDLQARVPAALTAGGYMKADALAISGDTAAADALEGHLDGTTFMPVDAHKPNFAVVGTTLTVKQPDGATTAYTKTVSTDATAEPITGAS